MLSRAKSYAVAAVWMRAVADCVGFGPSLAAALAVGYVRAVESPDRYRTHLERHLQFAGRWFVEIGETVEVAGWAFSATDYDRATTPLGSHRGTLFLACYRRLLTIAPARADRHAPAWKAASALRAHATLGAVVAAVPSLKI